MANRPGQKIKMTSIDELLCVPDMEGTIDIDVKAIYPFENHPFKVMDDEKMGELVESIAANGVLTPVLVRPDDEGTYEMISGHRRLHAAKKAGLVKIPAVIKEMTNDEATIAMVDANVQRERRNENIWRVPRKKGGISYGFGQANIWFASESDSNENLKNFLNRIARQIDEYVGDNWIDKYED